MFSRIKYSIAMSLVAFAFIFTSCVSEKSAQRNGEESSDKNKVLKRDGDDKKNVQAKNENDEEEEEVLKMPTSYIEMSERLEFLCPAPFFKFKENFRVETAFSMNFIVEGSTMRAEPALGGRLILGVLGAIKDPTLRTRKNLERAEEAFEKAGVNAVLLNGDLAEDEDLDAVFMMVGEVFKRPVFAHSGNIEWSASFNHAWEAAAQKHPQLFNLNWIREVDFGKHTLLTLPGYFDSRFMRSGACHYEEDDVQAMFDVAQKAKEKGHVLLLSSHGPPRGKLKTSLDVVNEGDHVGDLWLNNLIEKSKIQVGIFSHILEAGGRANLDLAGTPVALKRRKLSKPFKKLFINVGSASAGGWEMNDGKQNEGMAALLVVTKDGTQVQFLKLR